MSKRARDEAFARLSVFTYTGRVCCIFVPHAETEPLSHATLSSLFGAGAVSGERVFGLTASAAGVFFIVDEADVGLFAAAKPPKLRHRCLYIHDSADEHCGGHTSGTLAALSARLAAAGVAVLNVCSLARNFMLVREPSAEKALELLRATVEPPQPDAQAARADGAAAGGAGPSSPAGAASAKVSIELLAAPINIGALSVNDLETCAHALITLLLLPRAPLPAFAHLFSMGGELSLMVEASHVDALNESHPASARMLHRALDAALPELGYSAHGSGAEPAARWRGDAWRAFAVRARDGCAEVGLLSAVAAPLHSLPLMNVSTLDENYVLVRSDDASRALELLKPHFDVKQA